MPQLQLRRAIAADAAQILAVTRAAYAQWVPLIGREPKPMGADYAHAVAEHIIDLLQVNGELLALIEVIPAADHLLIENIAVLPAHHGKGFGDHLLRHADDVARSLGLSETRLYTNAAFASNLAFYARRGYQEYRRETFAPGTIAVHMRKSL
jgi:GNAT superfamily N-acetyltransferase